MSKKENQDNVNPNSYQDRGGLSTKKLNFGLWFVSNRKYFMVAITIILILLSTGFFFYSGYHYTYYLLEGKQADQEILNELSKNDTIPLEYKLKNSAQDLQFYSVDVFKVEGDYDLVTKIVNPNDRYYADYYYCFVENEVELACANNFIFPLESKYLIQLATKNTHQPNAQLRIKSISWHRVNLHQYPDWTSFYNEHLNFTTTDIRFKPARKSALSENLSLDVLEFNISNNTAYSYWEVPLDIILFNGTQVVGTMTHVLDEFPSGQERSVRLVWSGDITNATEVQITPNLDIVNSDIYMKY